MSKLLALPVIFLIFGCLVPVQVIISGSNAGSSLLVYRARFDVTTTSDWTSVFIVSGAELGGFTYNVIKGQGAPKLHYYGNVGEKLLLHIGKKQFDETLVKIKVTVTLANLHERTDIVIRIKKGYIGGTEISVYNHNGAETKFIRKLYAESEEEDFSINAKDLMTGGPLTISIPSSNKLVWAFYYPWYNARDWRSPQMKDKPLIGDYGSADSKTIELHMKMAKSAGIDGFIVSWWGLGSQTDLNLRTILDVASRNNFKITIYFESLQPPGVPRTEDELLTMFRDFFIQYGSDGRYFRIDGKPVIFVWAVDSQPVNVWRNIFNKMKEQGHEAIYIAETSNPTYLEVFDGIHIYGPTGAEAEGRLDQLYRSLSLAAKGVGKLWCATISPGCDLTALDRPTRVQHPREDGRLYQRIFEAAQKSEPDWLLITSWNEW